MGLLSLPWDARPIEMRAPAGFNDLYRRYSDTVYRTAMRVTGNSADAEDVLQTVFLRVLNQGERLDPAVVPEAYFRRAATNASLDVLRQRGTRAESQLDDSLPHAAHDAPPLLKERLRRALSALSERDAEMFILRYIEGLTNGELAEMYGMEKASIAVRLHRIRQVLQEELQR